MLITFILNEVIHTFIKISKKKSKLDERERIFHVVEHNQKIILKLLRIKRFLAVYSRIKSCRRKSVRFSI